MLMSKHFKLSYLKICFQEDKKFPLPKQKITNVILIIKGKINLVRVQWKEHSLFKQKKKVSFYYIHRLAHKHLLNAYYVLVVLEIPSINYHLNCYSFIWSFIKYIYIKLLSWASYLLAIVQQRTIYIRLFIPWSLYNSKQERFQTVILTIF